MVHPPEIVLRPWLNPAPPPCGADGAAHRMIVQPLMAFPDLAVLLNPGGAQTTDAVPVDQVLPQKEFLDRNVVPAAGVVEADNPRTDGLDHLGLSADNPAFGVRRGQIF